MKPTKPLKWVKGMRAGYESVDANQSEQYSWFGKTIDTYVFTAEIDHIDEEDNIYSHMEGTFRKHIRPLSVEYNESPITVRHAEQLYQAIEHVFNEKIKCHLMLLKGTKYGKTKGGVKSAVDGDYWKVTDLSGTVKSGFDFVLKRTE